MKYFNVHWSCDDLRITIKHRPDPYPLSTSFEESVLLSMEAQTFVEALAGRHTAVAAFASAVVAVPDVSGCAVVPGGEGVLYGGERGGVLCGEGGGTHPVARIRRSRTRMAPTRRFMQFERREAREARVCKGGGRSIKSEGFGEGEVFPLLTMKYVSQRGRNRSWFVSSRDSRWECNALRV